MKPMLSASDFVNTSFIPIRERAGYIWGMSGALWTQALQDRYALQRETTRKYGAKWIGRRVWDCSGLIVWIFKQYGLSIYHGSNTIWQKFCSDKGKIVNGRKQDGTEIKAGSVLFLYDGKSRHHIGVYAGNGVVNEAKSTYYGCVQSDLSHWDEWGELIDVDYSGEVVLDEVGTLRKGSRNDEVKSLQEELNKLGYDAGKADGIFGAATYDAVMWFQTDAGLTVDGVVGAETRKALDAALGKKPIGTGSALGTLRDAVNTINVAVTAINKVISAMEDTTK